MSALKQENTLEKTFIMMLASILFEGIFKLLWLCLFCKIKNQAYQIML